MMTFVGIRLTAIPSYELGEHGDDDLIRTVRGTGYALDAAMRLLAALSVHGAEEAVEAGPSI